MQPPACDACYEVTEELHECSRCHRLLCEACYGGDLGTLCEDCEREEGKLDLEAQPS